MLAGVASFQSTGAGLGGPMCLAMIAEAHAHAGLGDEGLGLLEGGLGMIGEYQDKFFDAEVLRVRGDLLLVTATPDSERAEHCYREAIELARRQQARSFELRTATRLARLLRDGDRVAEARALLTPIHRQLDLEVGDRPNPDLRDAAALLSELGG